MGGDGYDGFAACNAVASEAAAAVIASAAGPPRDDLACLEGAMASGCEAARRAAAPHAARALAVAEPRRVRKLAERAGRGAGAAELLRALHAALHSEEERDAFAQFRAAFDALDGGTKLPGEAAPLLSDVNAALLLRLEVPQWYDALDDSRSYRDDRLAGLEAQAAEHSSRAEAALAVWRSLMRASGAGARAAIRSRATATVLDAAAYCEPVAGEWATRRARALAAEALDAASAVLLRSPDGSAAELARKLFPRLVAEARHRMRAGGGDTPEWKGRPAAAATAAWVALRGADRESMSEPGRLGEVLPLLLPLCDDHEPRHKAPGLGALAHVLRASPRADVRFHLALLCRSLSSSLGFREAPVVRALLPCVEAVWAASSPPDGSPRAECAWELLREELREVDFLSLGGAAAAGHERRPLLAAHLGHLPAVLGRAGLGLVPHLRAVLPLLFRLLDQLRFERDEPALLAHALDAVAAAARACGPRAGAHAGKLAEALARVWLTREAVGGDSGDEQARASLAAAAATVRALPRGGALLQAAAPGLVALLALS